MPFEKNLGGRPLGSWSKIKPLRDFNYVTIYHYLRADVRHLLYQRVELKSDLYLRQHGKCAACPLSLDDVKRYGPSVVHHIKELEEFAKEIERDPSRWEKLFEACNHDDNLALVHFGCNIRLGLKRKREQRS